ncbi:hypothetical protein [Virgisporangium aurantiacum]|uniref:Uncharacterized protein n=1 Tax=Virgisporangium aurantiacum TaxID=175570 RepID=A0A8J4DYW9_9ACTN|nr:hypothetical protein [Virgisporangium aurantiacum]GIJ55091.1 hypothetical protein Vau01_026070 [Virgisporangium aurantiacum]
MPEPTASDSPPVSGQAHACEPTHTREPTRGSGQAHNSEREHRSGLESAYRHLLLAYPPRYRARRGDEIVDTLLAEAAPGQRFPRLAEVVDLVQAGLLERCRVGRVPGLAGGLIAAAPTGLALAAGIAAFLWWRVEGASAVDAAAGPSTAATPVGGPGTLGPIAYAAWLLAAGARAVLPAALGRFAIAVALVTTVVVVPVLASTPLGERPPLWVLMALAGFGIVALLGTAPGLGAGPPTAEARLCGAAGAVAVAVCTSTLAQSWVVNPAGYYGATIARVGAVVVGAVAALAVIAAFHLFHGRPAHDRLWAAALLGLPAGWLGPFTGTAVASPHAPHFGRFAQVLLATCVTVAVMHRLARHPHPQRPQGTITAPGASLARAGWHAIGTAAGLASWIALSYLGITGPSPSAGTGPPPYVLATMAVLIVVGLAAGVTGSPAGAWRPLLTAFTGTGAATWLVAVYVNDWTVGSWHDFGHTAAVATAVALVPLSECVVVAATVRRVERRRAATLVLVAALGWLMVLTIQYVPGWAPPLLGAVACVAAAQIPRHRRE